MQEELPPVADPVVSETRPETSLRDALEALHRSPWPTLPILDPATGQTMAVLSRPEPPRLGGMATPLGVYLHDGVSSGGAGFWGLFLTGVTMSGLTLLAQAGAHALAREASAHSPGLAHWEAKLPLGLQMWLSAVAPWLPLPLVFLLLRLAPLSGTHAAEHQVVHCVERSEPLVPENVRAMPRVHPRCGTNLFVGFTLFLLIFLAVFCAATAGGRPLLDAVSLSAMLAGPAALSSWRRVGGWFQQWVATRPASDRQIAGAIRAAEEVLARRRSWMENGMVLRFAWGRWLWTVGLAQLVLGCLAVYGLLSLAERVWPRLTGWVE